ncbi:hypothetical protein BHM03_00019183 [Ensete ventricosum]|nr:hypothetical protein BHM03_00019183 [Ensete ventricosum]
MVNSGTNPGNLAKGVKSGINPGDFVERVNSGTNPEDLAGKVNLGTSPGDLAERVNSGTNPGNFAERVNSGTNPEDLAEKVNSGKSHRDLAERVNSGTSPGDLAERVNSGTNPGDLTENVNSGKSPGDLAERVNSGTNPRDLAENVNSGTSPVDLAEMFKRARHVHLGGCSEAGLRFPLHPLIEECLRWWRISPSQVAPNSWRYLVVFLAEFRGAGIISTRDLFMACFRLCKSRGGYYLTARVGFQVSGAPSNNKGWKSRYLFVSGLVWGFKLDWSAHPIDNAPPYLSEEEFILVGRLKGILSSSCAITEMTELWLDAQDLGDLRGMPKMSDDKAPSTRAAAPAQEVDVSPTREAPKASSKRPIDASTEQVDDPARRHKKVTVLTKRHKSRHGEGESRSHSKGKEPVASSEELEMPVESDDGGTSLVHHRPRSMKDLFRIKVHKDDAGYYTLQMSDLGHHDPDKKMKARWAGLKNSTKVWNDSSATEEFERGLLILSWRGSYTHSPRSQHFQMALFDRVHDVDRLITFIDYQISHLQRELDALKSGGGPEVVAKAKERASELEQELEKTKREWDEALQQLEASEKELNEV